MEVKINFFLKLLYPIGFFLLASIKKILLRYRLVIFPLIVTFLASGALYFSTLNHAQSPIVSLDYSKEQKLLLSTEQIAILSQAWKNVLQYQPNSLAIITQLMALKPISNDQLQYQEKTTYLNPN